MKFLRKIFAVLIGLLIVIEVFLALPLSVASLLISNKTKLKSFMNDIEIYDIAEGALQNTAYKYFESDSENISTKVTDEFIKSVVNQDSINDEMDKFVDSFYDWKVSPDKDFIYKLKVSDSALWTDDEQERPQEITVLEIEANSDTANAIASFYKTINLIPYVSIAVILVTLVLYILVSPGGKLLSAISGVVCAVLGAGASILLWLGIKNSAQTLSERVIDQYADYISDNVVSDYISMDPIDMISTLVEKSAVWFSTESISLTLYILSGLGGLIMIFIIISIIKKVISAPSSTASQEKRKKVAVEAVVEPGATEDEDMANKEEHLQPKEKKVILEGKIELQDEDNENIEVSNVASEDNEQTTDDTPVNPAD